MLFQVKKEYYCTARDNVFYYTLGKTMESSKVATQFS